MSSDPTAVTKLYEQIPLESMQQVSDSYLAWYVDRVTRQLDEHMAALRSELRENDAKEAGFRPSPNELSAIERLQRSGVTGVDLLDRMVEQGEDWLVVTMRRLDHFEKTGLAPKDYSTWCEHALGGAYDWIDHERLAASGSPAASTPRQPAASSSGGDYRNGNSRPGNEGPTAPVPSTGGWSGSNQGGSYSGGQGDDGKDGRNIFRIFSN
ncbi:MAG TPA: hypothetical protein VHR15_14060 [Ktedonobacterales bacterium]|jgi:hypothetical protein|nr:hypothetical protein [Ktedonobacterales bacterium]